MAVPGSSESIGALFQSYIAGNPNAKERLLAELRPFIRMLVAHASGRWAVRLADDSDLTQETMLVIANHVRERFQDPAGPATFRGTTLGEFIGWVSRIAHRKVLEFAERERRREPTMLNVADPAQVEQAPVRSSAAMPGCAEALERSQSLARAIDRLPPHDGRLIRAVFFEGRGYDELVITEARSRAALRVAVHRALQRLARDADLRSLSLEEETP